jgi:hypothetical protein
MTDMFFTIDGVNHRFTDGESLQKALGNAPNRSIIMTDESGAVIGTGATLSEVERSKLLLKAMSEQRHLLKSEDKRILFTKGKKQMAKSLPRANSRADDRLTKTINQIDALAKSLNITIDNNSDDDVDIDDLYGFLNQIEDRVAVVEDKTAQILNYLGAPSVNGVLPAKA